MKKLLFLMLSCAGISTHAQVTTPLYANADESAEPLKTDEDGKYYPVKGGRIVYLDDDGTTYRLMDKKEQLLEEGRYSMAGDGYAREGKWTTYHDNGKVKITGYYKNDIAIGLWQQFSPGGQLQQQYNMAPIDNEGSYSCKAGSYQEFFENGRLKVNGFYKAVIDKSVQDTVEVVDPITDEVSMVILAGSKPRPEKTGTWEYYNEAGEIIKTEEY